MPRKPALAAGLRQQQRLAVFGRMRMAEWIEMPEREFAREIALLERDALFLKLRDGAVRRQRWPRARFAGIGALNEAVTSGGGERVRVEERLEAGGAVMDKIRALGAEAFERYFLYAEEALPLAEIARRSGVSPEDAAAIRDFLLEVGAEAEFSSLPKASAGLGAYCVARLGVEDGEASFEFFSPHWARGLYQIRYDLLETMKDSGQLDAEEQKRLPGLLKRLETVNLRQSTMFRVLETLAKVQSGFLTTRRDDAKKPVSLRMLARRLDLAPSTVSRALSGRTVRLPWDKEVPLIELLPGRRRQLRLILGRWLEEDASPTDAALAARLKKEFGIAVSRRTVNAVRHERRPRR
jgi:hypothetical protein